MHIHLRCLLLVALTLRAFPASAQPAIWGDSTGDGRITLADVTLALRAAVGLATLTSNQLTAGDIYPNPGTAGRRIGDGKITLADVQRLLMRTVGLLDDDALRPPPWVTTYAGYGPGVTGSRYIERDGPPDVAHNIDFRYLHLEPSGSLLFTGRRSLRRWFPDGSTESLIPFSEETGHADGPIGEAIFNTIVDPIVLPNGAILFEDEAVIRRYDPATGLVSTFAGQPVPPYVPEEGEEDVAWGKHNHLTLACKDRFADGPADEALFGCYGRTMAVGSDGRVYVADATNYRIRVVSMDGSVSTLSGSGLPFEAGVEKDGPSETSRFGGLKDLAVDPAGNLLVADGALIRKVDRQGTVTTIAGTTTPAPGSYGGADGPADRTAIRADTIACSADGRVVFAWGSLIRERTADGRIVTVAGSAELGYRDGPGLDARFGSIARIRFDEAGNLLIADPLNGYLRRLRPDGVVDTVGWGAPVWATEEGPARHVLLEKIRSLDVGPNGTLYFSNVSRIQQVSADGKWIRWVMGYPEIHIPGQGPLPEFPPSSLAISGDDMAVAADETVYVTRAFLNLIKRGRPGTEPEWVAGSGVLEEVGYRDGPVEEAFFNFPFGIAIDERRGRVYVADNGNDAIRVIEGGQVWTLAGRPIRPGEFSIAVDGKGEAARFVDLKDMEIDDDGILYVGDYDAIRRVTPDGIVTTLARAPGNGAFPYLARVPDGTIYAIVAGLGPPDVSGWRWTAAIHRLRPGSDQLELFAGSLVEDGFRDGPTTEARFHKVTDIVADREGNVYVVDQDGVVIRKIEP